MNVEQLYVNIATVVAIVVALILATRNITEAATRIQVSTEATDKRMNAAMAALEQVPLIAQKVAQIEDQQEAIRKRVFSDWPNVVSRVAVLEEKGRSTDRFKAVRLGSVPDTEGE